MSNPIKPKGPRQVSPQFTPMNWVMGYLASSIGAKIIVALTGTLLAGFVVFHMIGNVKVMFGQEEINAYAHFLKHSLGPYLWLARAGLLTVFLVHIGVVLWLKNKSTAARPIAYMNQRNAQATLTSRTMIWTGLLIGAFVLFHLAHFTFGWMHHVQNPDGTWTNYMELKDSKGRHDVYSMMIAGFRTPWLATIYLITMGVLFAHLSHGLQSVMRTLGLTGTRFTPIWNFVAVGTAAFVVLGNVAIVLAIATGLVPPIR